jgi:hypothetical protein
VRSLEWDYAIRSPVIERERERVREREKERERQRETERDREREHIPYRTRSVGNTFYPLPLEQDYAFRSPLKENTFYTEHMLYRTRAKENTFYPEHMLYRTRAKENTFYSELCYIGHVLRRTRSVY